MRDIKTQMAGILRRKQYYLVRRQARRLTALAAGLAAVLVAAILTAPSVTGSVQMQAGSVLGATILGPEAGGYVIVALIAFGLGIVTTVLTQKCRRMKKMRLERDADGDRGPQA